MSVFSISVSELCWINGAKDDPQDLCLHGRVTAQIGDVILQDEGTVSATALYLLKTLTEDKIMSPYDIQMIPCCGHTILPDEAGENVIILGCDTGTDWSTSHAGGMIRIELPSGKTELIDSAVYRDEVFRFADRIEAFYNACAPKMFDDDSEREGYAAFWNEWRRRRRT